MTRGFDAQEELSLVRIKAWFRVRPFKGSHMIFGVTAGCMGYIGLGGFPSLSSHYFGSPRQWHNRNASSGDGHKAATCTYHPLLPYSMLDARARRERASPPPPPPPAQRPAAHSKHAKTNVILIIIGGVYMQYQPYTSYYHTRYYVRLVWLPTATLSGVTR